MSRESSEGSAEPLAGDSLERKRSISLEELISLGQGIGGDDEQQAGMTPRLSIISTATLDDFSRNLYKISSNISQMRTLNAQLGGPTDSHDHRAKLNAITEVTKATIIKANEDLRQLGLLIDLSDEEHVRLTRMTRDFHLLMGQFQESQKLSLVKCRDFVMRAQAIASEYNDENAGPVHQEDDDEQSPLINAHMCREQMLGLENEISYNQALIQERQQGIQEIEVAMGQVHEIFCDLGILATEQQGVLDNIEANIESSALRTRAAVRELTITRDAQRRRRGNFCCMALMALFVFLLAVALIFSL